MNVNPYALLAAIISHMGETITQKVRADDAAKDINAELPAIDIRKEGDTFLCAMPLKFIEHFMKIQYEMTFEILQHTDGDTIGVIGFQKTDEAPRLLTADGKTIIGRNIMTKLISQTADYFDTLK